MADRLAPSIAPTAIPAEAWNEALEHKNQIRGLAYRLAPQNGGPGPDSEDLYLVGITAIAGVIADGRFRPGEGATAATFYYRVAQNAMRQEHRRQQGDRRKGHRDHGVEVYPQGLWGEEAYGSAGPDEPSDADRDRRFEASAGTIEFEDGLLAGIEFEKILDLVTPPQADVLRLIYGQDMTGGQAAVALGISRQAVNQRVHGAMATLREKLGAA